MAVPSTASSPSTVLAPVRSSLPSPTVATSLTQIGMPSWMPSLTFLMSSMFSIKPVERMLYCSPDRSM